MSLQTRLESLQRKHELLHETIEALEGERAPDKTIQNYKKLKLSVKDEIETIKRAIDDTKTS